MNNSNLRKKAKIFGIINTILIIYIFTLTIGYSFFKETLNISGTVSADNPDLGTCPLEMREINDGTPMKSKLGSDGFRRYFAEKQDFNLLYGDSETNNITPSSIIDFYDRQKNTYSFMASNLTLFPNDKNNKLNMCTDTECLINEYKTLSKPIYFIFENTTAYPLENFVIKKDEKNDIIPKSPLENFDIRWAKYSTLTEALDAVKSPADEVATWNSFTSIFNNYLTPSGSGTYGSYYSYQSFYDLSKMSFSTQTVNNGEFLVLGIHFNDVENALAGTFTADFDITREDDGISFEFWEEKFYTDSAFKMRFAFIKKSEVSNFYTNLSNDFYTNPGNFEYPVGWWNKQELVTK